jgi:uncharacterized protein (TIGR02598 family)
MKTFRSARTKKSCLGFSLVEASLSVGILGFGFISLAPLLSVGLTTARQARDGRISAQIAETFADQARDDTLTAGSTYCDDQGAACPATSACYQVQATLNTLAGNCTRLTVQVTPVATPNRPLDYAVVLPPQ